MDDLLRRLAQEAQLKQHRENLRREAGIARMLRRFRANEVTPVEGAYERVRFIRKERRQMLKRKIAYLLAVLFLVALLIAEVVQAAGGIGGGRGYLVR